MKKFTWLLLMAATSGSASGAPQLVIDSTGFSVAQDGQLSGFAKIRADAEKGDAKAQYAMGADCQRHTKSADALTWYRLAAAQDHLDAIAAVGSLLLAGTHYGQAVEPSVPEGLQFTLLAATRGHQRAQLRMADCYEKGLGVEKDLVEAYKWAVISSRHGLIPISDGGESLSRKLTTEQVKDGLARADAFKTNPKAKPIPLPTAPNAPTASVKLTGVRLAGIGGSSAKPIAVINNEAFAVGDRKTVKTKTGSLELTCLEIRDGVAVVRTEPDGPRTELRLGAK